MNKELSEWQQCFEERISLELEQQGHQDAAHDLSHVRRVWRHCQTINEQDNFGVDPRLVRINTLFHHTEKYRHPWELLSILTFGRLHPRVE